MTVPPDSQPGAPTGPFRWGSPTPEPAPPEPPKRRGGGVLVAIAAVLGLIVAIVVGVLVSGGDAEDPSRGQPGPECEVGEACGGDEDAEGAPEAMEIPEGYLGVRSLGALTPIPGDGWFEHRGPGADELLAEDAHAMSVSHTDTWISYFMVGRLGEFALDADPEDLHGTAVEIVDTWVFDYPYSGTTGLTRSDPTLTDTVVDSHPAVLLETRVSWDSLDSSPDTYEDLALLLVHPDDDGIFLGVAAVPESGTQRFEPAVDALLSTTFQHNTYLP